MYSSFDLPNPSDYQPSIELQELNSDGTPKTYTLPLPNTVTTSGVTNRGGSSLRRRKVYKPSRISRKPRKSHKTRRTKPKTKKQYRRKRYTKRCKKSHRRSRH